MRLAPSFFSSGCAVDNLDYTQIPFIVCIVFLCLTFVVSSVTWFLTKESESETRRVARLRREAGVKDNAIIQEEVNI